MEKGNRDEPDAPIGQVGLAAHREQIRGRGGCVGHLYSLSVGRLGPMDAPNPETSPLEPGAALQAEIDIFVRQGYRVVSQSESAAYLLKNKKFSIMWALIWFVIAVFPFVIYLIYYVFKWDHRVYLVVDPATGKVERKLGTRKVPYPGPRVAGW